MKHKKSRGRKDIAWVESFESENDFKNWCLRRLVAIDADWIYQNTSVWHKSPKQHKNLADVPVRHRRQYSRGIWKHLEFKTLDGTLQPGQEERCVYGDVFIVRTWQDFCDALEIPFYKDVADYKIPFDEPPLDEPPDRMNEGYA